MVRPNGSPFRKEVKGFKSLFFLVQGDTTGLSSIGIFEAIPLVIPAIRVLRDVLKKLEQNPPDVVVKAV